MSELAPSLARDGESFTVQANGTEWSIAWYPPPAAPEGTPHGANALCVTVHDEVVLISDDGSRWGWPGGRPEVDESWEQTLRREVREEVCAEVTGAELLGFCRAAGVSGPEEGRVLVRSLWRADVTLLPWQPDHEIRNRRLVPAPDLVDHLWMEEGFEPIYYRALVEAKLVEP